MEQDKKNKSSEESQFVANDTDFLFDLAKSINSVYNDSFRSSLTGSMSLNDADTICPACGRRFKVDA